MYRMFNGMSQWVPDEQASPAVKAAVSEIARNHPDLFRIHGEQILSALDTAETTYYVDVTDPVVQANAIAAARGSNLGAEIRESYIRDGHAPDVSKLPPQYVERLRDAGVTDATVADFAKKMYPQLSDIEAVRKFESNAARMDPAWEPGARPPTAGSPG